MALTKKTRIWFDGILNVDARLLNTIGFNDTVKSFVKKHTGKFRVSDRVTVRSSYPSNSVWHAEMRLIKGKTFHVLGRLSWALSGFVSVTRDVVYGRAYIPRYS